MFHLDQSNQLIFYVLYYSVAIQSDARLHPMLMVSRSVASDTFMSNFLKKIQKFKENLKIAEGHFDRSSIVRRSLLIEVNCRTLQWFQNKSQISKLDNQMQVVRQGGGILVLIELQANQSVKAVGTQTDVFPWSLSFSTES